MSGWEEGRSGLEGACLAAAVATESRFPSQTQSHKLGPCLPVPAISLVQILVDPSMPQRLTPGVMEQIFPYPETTLQNAELVVRLHCRGGA